MELCPPWVECLAYATLARFLPPSSVFIAQHFISSTYSRHLLPFSAVLPRRCVPKTLHHCPYCPFPSFPPVIVFHAAVYVLHPPSPRSIQAPPYAESRPAMHTAAATAHAQTRLPPERPRGELPAHHICISSEERHMRRDSDSRAER